MTAEMPGLPPAVGSALDLIGNTPLLEVKNLDTGPCRLFLKLENQNPGGSIKDRVALSMIRAAEAGYRRRCGRDEHESAGEADVHTQHLPEPVRNVQLER